MYPADLYLYYILEFAGLEQLVYCPSYMLPNGIMSDIECWHVHIVPNGLCGLVLELHSINLLTTLSVPACFEVVKDQLETKIKYSVSVVLYNG